MTSEYEQLAQRLDRIERKLKGNAGSRLSNASIENSTIPTYDETGQVQAYIGRQYDGAFGVLDVAGPTPPTPAGFNVEIKPGALLVEWLGEWENDEVAPSNFQRVEFHASTDPALSGLLRTTLKNTLTTPRGETVRIDLPYESVQYIRMVARTTSGKVSAASPVMGPYTIPRLTPEDVQIDLDAIGGNTISKGDTAPAGPNKIGDLWLQTPNNVAYRWEGTPEAWVASRDQGIVQALNDAFQANQAASQAGIDALAAQSTAGTAQGTANTALSTANSKTTTFSQPGQPPTTGRVTGDEWIDTDDGNKRYYWNGSAWTAGTLGAAAISATARQLGAITTFRQAAAPTTGMIDGDFWIDSDDGNKVYIRAAGAWVLSRDPDINVAITNAATAQAVADGKMRIFPQPDAPTGLTAGDLGDMWIETDNANKTWTWNGTAWEERLIGNAAIQPQSLVASDVIATGTVTAALLEAVLVLVSKIIVGDPLAEHIEIEDDISFISLDPDGVPYVAQRFGKSSAGTDATGNVIWQIDEGGYASVQDLSSTNEPVFAGLPLSDWVSASATFHAGGSRGNQTDPVNSAVAGELGYYEVTMEMDNLHQYLIQTSNLWIRRQSGAGTNRIDLNIRYTVSTDPAVDPPPVTTSSPLFARNSQPLSNDLGGQFQITKLFRPSTPYAHFRFLLSVGYFAGGGYIEMGSANTTDAALGQVIEVDTAQLYAINLGAVPWTNRGITNSGSPPPAGTPTPPSVKRYTYTYTPLWTRRFRGDNTVHSDGGDAVQGQTPYYTSNGNQKTQIGDFRRNNATVGLVADLQGATIEKFEVYLYARAWHYNSGGTAVIRYHNNTGPTTYINVAGQALVGGWVAGQGRWVDLTSWGNIFRDGGAKGIEVGPGIDTNPIYYGTFHGHTGSHPPAIRVTYTK